VLDRLALEHDLHRALAAGEFVAHYQPEVRLSDGRIVGFEALARWEHPERGLLLPSEFLDVAEESGLLVEIGGQLLEQVCAQLGGWVSEFPELDLKVWLNLSAHQLLDPELAGSVACTLERYGVAPGRLCFEITETVLLDDETRAQEAIAALRGEGVQMGLDDFGTGYSSLVYLKQLDADTLKIDRSFVMGLGRRADDDAIVQALVGMAASFGLDVIAEGIEEPEQLARLRELGCGFGQGFLFSRALPGPEATALLRANPRW
jgi:EAL domain-containing protein (putative c-di-GMP-specific phosphodiesterase class I)